MSVHTADAAALLEHLQVPPAIVVGTSAGAGIAIDLAVRRPDLVRAVVAHEFPWRTVWHFPTGSQLAAFATIGALMLRGRKAEATDTLMRAAYTYEDGSTAWDRFPEEWKVAAREDAAAALADFRNSIGSYPSRDDLATIEVPVVCTYGERSPRWMAGLVRSLASAIPTATVREIAGAGHAAPFDATAEFVQVVRTAVLGGADPSRSPRSRRCPPSPPAAGSHTTESPRAAAGAAAGTGLRPAPRGSSGPAGSGRRRR
jgi:pimeloyl-ACP methyl ester carboxylesterase